MFTHSGYRTSLLYTAAGAAAFFSALFKIADLDFWWHLKTGQMILEQRAFQHTEIYSFTAAGREYIDHEWLFQVIQYLIFKASGPAGIILFKCLLVVGIYLLLARFLVRNQASHQVALAILLLSIAGGRTRFIERPELFSILFFIATYLWIDDYLRTGNERKLWPVPFLFLIWTNLHAAVILGLLLQAAFLAGVWIESTLKKTGYPSHYEVQNRQFLPLVLLFAVSILITGINPYGYRVLAVPFELTAIIDSGLLHNQEWQQPSLIQLPFFYICLLLTFALTAISFRRLHFPNFLLAAFLGYISLKYVRNVGLFCVCMPLLIAPYLRTLSEKLSRYSVIVIAANVVFLFYLVFNSPYQFGIGEASYFPNRIVRFTKEKNLQGNMINSYGFGGYLIWHLYPERKVFIDGRNEVYLPLLEKLIASRADNRSWKKLLSEYHIEYALLNYVDDLERLTVVDQNHKTTITYAPFSSTHFPRAVWALVYWDDNGMVFIKRNGLNHELNSLEYTSIFPEGRFYQESLVRAGRIDRTKAVDELRRKLREDPSCKRASNLLHAIERAVP